MARNKNQGTGKADELATVTPEEFARRAAERLAAVAADYEAPITPCPGNVGRGYTSQVAERLSRQFTHVTFSLVFEAGAQSLRATPRSAIPAAYDMTEKAAEAALPKYPARAVVEAYALAYSDGYQEGRASRDDEVRNLREKVRDAERPAYGPHPMFLMGPRHW